MMKKIPLIIDCDPGVDDVLAIVLANTKDCFDLRAITSVSGNVGINDTTKNLQIMKTLLGLQCPIARGEARPLVKDLLPSHAGKTHGNDGFGGYRHLIDHVKPADLDDLSAVKLIAKVLQESAEKVVIAAIGPLTNIAILVKAYPELLAKIERFSIMGGGLNYGNITPTAEFNFYADPEAAQIVMNSGVPITLAALDLTIQADIRPEDINRFEKIDNEVADISTKILAVYASNDAALHDPVSILILSNPEIFESKELHIQVETNEGKTRAMSYADQRGRGALPNCTFITKVNRELFIDEIEKALAYYGGQQ